MVRVFVQGTLGMAVLSDQIHLLLLVGRIREIVDLVYNGLTVEQGVTKILIKVPQNLLPTTVDLHPLPQLRTVDQSSHSRNC